MEDRNDITSRREIDKTFMSVRANFGSGSGAVHTVWNYDNIDCLKISLHTMAVGREYHTYLSPVGVPTNIVYHVHLSLVIVPTNFVCHVHLPLVIVPTNIVANL